LSQAVKAARVEARNFMGRCTIDVTDSQTTSWGLGVVVSAAAQAADNNLPMDQIVRLVRGMLPHIYVIFFVERLDYLEQGGRIGLAQALLGTMLRIKPILLIEEGEIIPMEKVRTRDLAIDKLADFVAEFASLQKVAILRSPLGNDIGELRVELDERLEGSLPDLDYPIVAYDPVLACHMGPEALGVAVIERH
jgi:DegV family protein with EDD domain